MMKDLIYNPIIPIWLMAVICVAMIAMYRKGLWSNVRRVLIAILLFVINLRIMIPGEVTEVKQQELNSYVLFVIDDTISMLAEDGKDNETRLECLKRDCGEIVDGLPGAHFAVISFHNTASQLSPFTDNGEHIKNVINSIYPIEDLYAHGSSLNVPKGMMISALDAMSKKEGINLYLFFVSDGEITSDIPLETYSDLRGYVDGGAVLGYGTKAGGQMHYRDPYTEELELITYYDPDTYDLVPGISCIDENNLKQISSDMRLKYVNMTEDNNRIASVVSEIRNKSEVVTTNSNMGSSVKLDNATDTYFWFVIPLFVLLMFEAVSIIRRK